MCVRSTPPKKKKKKGCSDADSAVYNYGIGGIYVIRMYLPQTVDETTLNTSTLWWSKAVHYQVFYKRGEASESVFNLFFLFILFFFWFPFQLPCLVSGALLGWTLLGWICLLIDVDSKVDGNKGRHEDKG